MARKNVIKVFNSWVSGVAAKGDSKRTIWTDGKTIYSYSTPIAHGHLAEVTLVSGRGPSVTTSCQIGGLRSLMRQSGIDYREADAAEVKRLGSAG